MPTVQLQPSWISAKEQRMQMIAAILLTMLMVQDKSAPQEPTKQTAPATEQKADKPMPVVLPEAKSVQLKITDGSAPQVEATRPITIRMKAGDGETKELHLSAAQVQQLIAERLSQNVSAASQIVFENGAFYIKTASFTIPMSGGGASGCLGEASRSKITFHHPALQRMIGAEKAPAPEKK
jgi:hypothetical protein